MKTQVKLTLVIVGCLQAVWASSFFDDVQPMKPNLPIDPSWVSGPVRGMFGVTNSSFTDPHIVGGKESVPHSHPHQVALKLRINERTHFCGGSLIADQWVVTAAHCADGVSSTTVFAGVHNINNIEHTAVVTDVVQTVVHPRYDRRTTRNDIALLKLGSSVIRDQIKTIRLPKISQKDESFWKRNVTMTGWGRDSDKATKVSPVLREVDSTVVSNFYCSFRYFFRLVEDTNICASGWGWKSPCHGDSGGPMYVKEDDGERTLIGITSFGPILGCEWAWPPVFTRVTSYLDWIHQTTGIVPRP